MKKRHARQLVAPLAIVIVGAAAAIGYASIRSVLAGGVAVVAIEESAYPIPGYDSDLQMIVGITAVQRTAGDVAVLVELRPDPQFKEVDTWAQLNRATGRFIVWDGLGNSHAVNLAFTESDDDVYEGRWAMVQTSDLSPGDPSMQTLLMEGLCKVEIDDPDLGKTIVTRQSPAITLVDPE